MRCYICDKILLDLDQDECEDCLEAILQAIYTTPWSNGKKNVESDF